MVTDASAQGSADDKVRWSLTELPRAAATDRGTAEPNFGSSYRTLARGAGVSVVDVTCRWHGGLTARRPATARSHQRIVDHVRGAITADPAALDLPGLAAGLGHTPFHVSRVFRRLTGTTLIQHRNDVRVAAAIDSFARGQRLADVAAELGFADQSHLGRVLQRSVQLAPGRLRDRLTAGGAALAEHRTTTSKARPRASI